MLVQDVTFFSGVGKCSFFKAFCGYSDFICGPRVNGSLSQWKSENSYLAFLRLVGTTYFVKYRSTYRGAKSPVTLFNSCTSTTIEDQYIQWLDKIRTHVWEEVQNEFDLPPSPPSLKLHWLRTVWVLNMWAQASSDKITTLQPTKHGWIQEDDGYSIRHR